jgi:hypothetical protein
LECKAVVLPRRIGFLHYLTLGGAFNYLCDRDAVPALSMVVVAPSRTFIRAPGYEKPQVDKSMWNISNVMNMPNQLPDPTSPSVTPPAGAGAAPSGAADH